MSARADLDKELDSIFAARDRANKRPTVAALEAIYRGHPTVPRVIYELAGAYDTAGEQGKARSLYEDALAAGLDGDVLWRCLLQYGSTLRNLGEYDLSLEVLRRGREGGQFPGSPSLAVFEAMTLGAADSKDAAIATLIEVVTDMVDSPDLNRYKPGLRNYADHLRSTE